MPRRARHAPRPPARIALLVDALDAAYDRRSWHGTNLRGSLRGVTARDAAVRPGRDRHNVWELAVHCAYWKYAAWRRITGEKRGSFRLRGSNWFVRPVPGADSDAAWRADLALLGETHRALRAAIVALADRDLDATPKGSKVTTATLINGIVAHDLYHAGQIQLIKRLMR